MDAHAQAPPYPPQPLHDKNQYQQFGYESYPPNQEIVPPPGKGPTVLTVTRAVALSVLAALIFLALAVVGLSAGLGISQRDLTRVKSDLHAAELALSSAGSLWVTHILLATYTYSITNTT
jgi:hypothetical protein